MARVGSHAIAATGVEIQGWLTGQIFLIWPYFYYAILCNARSHKDASIALRHNWLSCVSVLFGAIHWFRCSVVDFISQRSCEGQVLIVSSCRILLLWGHEGHTSWVRIFRCRSGWTVANQLCHTSGSGTVLSLFSLKMACQVEYRLNSKYSSGSKVSLASICNGSNHWLKAVDED